MRKITKIVDVNAHITNVQALVVVEDGIAKAQISFENLGYGDVIAVKFNAKGYNSFGDVVNISGKDEFLIIIQDILVEKNSAIEGIKIGLPEPSIRRIEMEECQVCYASGDVATYAGKKEIAFELDAFDSEDDEVYIALKEALDEKVTNFPVDSADGWVCACSRWNQNDQTLCTLCGHSKDEVMAAFTEEGQQRALENKRQLDVQREIDAAKLAEKKAETAKYIKKNIIVACIIVGLVAALISFAATMASRMTYSSEDSMRASLQGTYTWYNSYGTAVKQIVISGDTITYKWKYDSEDEEATIEKWGYKMGKIYADETLIVTNEGNIKQGSYLYEKGGYMSYSTSSSSSSSSYESGYSALSISNVKVSRNSSYTVCTGTIKNNGSKTYKYVKVKGSFKDSSGNVIDTDWTYAVGSEGLAPGESSTFRMSVDKDYDISSCSVSVYDYD